MTPFTRASFFAQPSCSGIGPSFLRSWRPETDEPRPPESCVLRKYCVLYVCSGLRRARSSLVGRQSAGLFSRSLKMRGIHAMVQRLVKHQPGKQPSAEPSLGPQRSRPVLYTFAVDLALQHLRPLDGCREFRPAGFPAGHGVHRSDSRLPRDASSGTGANTRPSPPLSAIAQRLSRLRGGGRQRHSANPCIFGHVDSRSIGAGLPWTRLPPPPYNPWP